MSPVSSCAGNTSQLVQKGFGISSRSWGAPAWLPNNEIYFFSFFKQQFVGLGDNGNMIGRYKLTYWSGLDGLRHQGWWQIIHTNCHEYKIILWNRILTWSCSCWIRHRKDMHTWWWHLFLSIPFPCPRTTSSQKPC